MSERECVDTRRFGAIQFTIRSFIWIDDKEETHTGWEADYGGFHSSGKTPLEALKNCIAFKERVKKEGLGKS